MTETFNRNPEHALVEEVKGDLILVNNSNHTRERDHLVVRCLKSLLELHNGHSENLSCITKVVKESFPDYDAATVHNCLVAAFPDLQAQQSNNKDEIHYLGIRYIDSQSTEYKVTNWLWQRFKVDEFGCVSFQTLLDIARKEIGYIKNTVIGHYVKKAFPSVYTRRSDRLRWYCGISLPEKELTVEERKRKIWLDSASKWLRENMKESAHGQEKCSLVFAALVQFIGKVSIDNCMAAVKCVFPNSPRKTIDRNAFYIGINFTDPNLREEIKYTPPKNRASCLSRPILSEEEKEIVSWLQNVIKVNERHREKLHDLTNMLRKKMDQNLTEKTCLSYIRKAFPDVLYRKRDGVAQITGIEIKFSYKPRDPWMEKAIQWAKEILTQRLPNHYEKLGPILEVLKKGLQCLNHAKLCQVIRSAFPHCSIKKSLEGKFIYGVSLTDDYRNICLPLFCDDDFMGDFSCVDMSGSPNHEEGDKYDMYTDPGDILGNSSQNNELEESEDNKLADTVKKLEEKVDKISSTVESMNTNMKRLQEEIANSNRQKDTLIVQLQQTLVLLSQQQFQRIVKPAESLLSNPNFLNLQTLQSLQTDVTKSMSLG